MIVKKNFNININIYDNIVDNILNIDEYIKNEIKQKYIYKPLKKYIPLECINFEYFYPQKNTERTENTRQFNIKLLVEFLCIRLFDNEIILDLTLDANNKFEDFLLLHKDVNKVIKIVAIELNVNQKYDKEKNICKIKRSEIIERKEYTTINCIVEKVAFPYIHFFRPSDIIKANNIISIPSKFKFNIIASKSHQKQMTIDELHEYIKNLKYTEGKMIFNRNNIIIEENKDEQIVLADDSSYFTTILIELYNYSCIH